MKLEITNIEPILQAEEEKIKGELCRVAFQSIMTLKEYNELKSKTKLWGVDVEVKNQDK